MPAPQPGPKRPLTPDSLRSSRPSPAGGEGCPLTPDSLRSSRPSPARGEGRGRPAPARLGEILDRIVRKEGLGRKPLQGRRLARKVLAERLGPELAAHADVDSVRTGVVVIAADSSALFQELEGFRRQELVEAFRGAGLKVREVRVQLAKGGR